MHWRYFYGLSDIQSLARTGLRPSLAIIAKAPAVIEFIRLPMTARPHVSFSPHSRQRGSEWRVLAARRIAPSRQGRGFRARRAGLYPSSKGASTVWANRDGRRWWTCQGRVGKRLGQNAATHASPGAHETSTPRSRLCAGLADTRPRRGGLEKALRDVCRTKAR